MSDTDLSRRSMLAAVALGGASTAFFSQSLLAQADAMGGSTEAERGDYFKPVNFYADGEWKLPTLPYANDALEPHIDAKTMEIHHGKHHKAYVDNLNRALKKLVESKGDLEPAVVEGLQRDISFNLGGHLLHSVFWGIVGPDASGKMGGEPDGKIADLINASFGNYEAFKGYFSKVAGTLKGSGWAVLAYSPLSDMLVTYALKDQDSTHAAGTIPVLAVDVWEHAYYLKYQNNRAAYITAWFNTINWPAVNALVTQHVAK